MRVSKVIQGIVDLIVRSCDPQAVVLFGSYAKGLQTIESDLDLMVVGNFDGSAYLRNCELRQLLHGYPIQIDLHLFTPQELQRELANPLGFVSTAMSTGHTLYSKPSCGRMFPQATN